MEIRQANLETDLPVLRQWMEKWGMTTLPDWWYPEENFVIEGVIFASYYKTNSKLAYLENIVSNPDIDHKDRFKGVELISKHIFKQAKEDGFNLVCGWTNNKSIIKNCNMHGMIASKPEYSVLIMDVRK